MSSFPPPAPAGGGRPAWLVPVAAGCGCLLLLGVLACAGLFWFGWHVTKESEQVGVAIELPAQVRVGDAADLVVTVTNRKAGESITIDSIDVPSSLLERFTVSSTDPAPTGSQTIFSQVSYDFGSTIPAGETRAFTWHLRASTPGRASGELDVTGPLYVVTNVVQSDVLP